MDRAAQRTGPLHLRAGIANTVVMNAPVVDDDAREAYERDGVVCLRKVFSEAELEDVHQTSVGLLDAHNAPYASERGKVTRLGNQPTVEGDVGRAFVGVYMSERESSFRHLVYEGRLAALARELMGSQQIRFFYDQVFAREPGTQTPTEWHNDLPFWPFKGGDLISCWIALTPVTTADSGIEYVAGSHRWGIDYRATSPILADEAHPVAPNFSLPESRTGHTILSWEMLPGDVLFHHPLVVHGTGPNNGAGRRIGVSIRYLGDDVQWDPRDKAMQIPRYPNVAVGEYPADDFAFPVVL